MREDLKRYITGAAILAGVAMAPTTGWAQDEIGPGGVETTEEELDEAVSEELEAGEAAEKPWSLSATVLTRAYQGMFSDLENQDPEYSPGQAASPSASFDRWLNLYLISGSYALDDFTFGAEIVWSHWLTVGGGYNEQYEFRFEDPTLTASWSGYTIEPIDTKVSSNLSIALPASDVSQTANVIASNTLSGKLSRTFFDKLSLSYTLAGTWIPHTAEIATASPDVVQIYREDDFIGNDVAFIGYRNTQFALTNALGASFVVWDDLRLSASYAIAKYWSYHADDDDALTPNVNGINTGRGTTDLTTATLGLSYPVGDYISLAGGIRTKQQPKSDDQSTFRFPWWNVDGAAGNRSAIQFSVTGTY